MSTGRKNIPLHEAEKHLLAQLAQSAGEGGIQLDTSAEAQSLPVTDLGASKKLELHTIDLDKPSISQQYEARREAELQESYEVLKDMYLKGELSAQDLQELFIDQPRANLLNVFESVKIAEDKSVPATKVVGYVSPDELSAHRLLDEINENKLPHPPTLSWHTPEGAKHEPKPEGERWADQPDKQAFLALCQEYTKGMPLGEIRKRFLVNTKDRSQQHATIDFLKRYQAGFNPSAYLMNEILLSQSGLKEKELSQQDWQQASGNFLTATREVWGDFVYSGKWQKDKKTGEYIVTEDADLDAKTSLLLLRLARVESALKKKPLSVPPGEYKSGATTIDSGLKSGVTAERGGTVVIDNHQRGRGYETSSAKILYNLLRSRGDIRESGPLRGVVDLSVLDDNARLITNREQLDSSDRTLRGLHRFMTASRLLKFFESNWDQAAGQVRRARNLKRGDNLLASDITEHLLDRKLSEAELKQWGLVDNTKDQRRTVKRAHELLLDVPEDELMEQGRVLDTRLGKMVVNIEGMGEKRFLGGHDTVIADRRFQGYLSWDQANQSMLLNTTKRDLDLSSELKGFLEKHPELVSVRGALIIKPKNGQPISVTLSELLGELGYDITQAKGQIKDYLEHGLREQKLEQLEKTILDSPDNREVVEAAREYDRIVAAESDEEDITPSVPGAPPVVPKLEPPTEQIAVELPPATDISFAPAEQPPAPLEEVHEPPPPAAIIEEQPAPPTETAESKAEGWEDETGIKFTRELTLEELRVKDEIDDSVRHRLAAKAHDLLSSPSHSSKDKEPFTDGFVERGMNHGSIKAARTARYRERSLPVSESGGAAA